MEPQLLTIVALIGLACVLFAAFATDWRLGLAVLGAFTVAVAVRLEQGRPSEPLP